MHKKQCGVQPTSWILKLLIIFFLFKSKSPNLYLFSSAFEVQQFRIYMATAKIQYGGQPQYPSFSILNDSHSIAARITTLFYPSVFDVLIVLLH